MAVCPYCQFEAATTQDEVEHMNGMHPQIVTERLRQAGFGWDEIAQLGRKGDRCEVHSHYFLLQAAEQMAAAITILVHRGVLDARSLPADALLNYMQEVNGGFNADCWSEEEAIARLKTHG